MTASYEYITDTGTIVADTADLLTDVQNEWKTALGQNLNVDAATTQGTLIAGSTIARTGVMKNNAEMANLLNPDQTYGIFLDAVCSFAGIGRGKNTPTTASGIVVTGDPQKTIPAGSRVKTDNGDVFSTVTDVTIPASRTTTVNLQSQAYGVVPLPVGDLEIIDAFIGWGSCTVPVGTVAKPGTTALKDGPLKTKRKQQLFKQGIGSSGAIKANALDIDGITSVNVVENNTAQIANPVQGIRFTLPNAMWVCVDGMTANNKAALALAIYRAHQGGCPWDYGAANQGTQVDAPNGTPVVDPWSKKTYYVKLVTAVLLDCYVNITVGQGTSTADPTESVQSAMLSYANGQEDGEEGLVIGAPVSSWEIGGSISRQQPGLYVKECKVAVVPAGQIPVPGDYVYEKVINQFERAVLAAGRINVTIV
ncbi:hypothetical protein BcepF1.098 [Burkholderia phage BcepF1]|uniref:Baseplate protein J-like barrel domain-containing protein n=1 Tax=Burkholderia phage BcepF1 TaxID=2886897 RepID=A1Z002_9CAUD|nr:baseplate wedge subunit [Burkholderia phage BcepF1]ABL96829.1 hypothetical protein BcepF1.098 [Burkholderia phage BcepF1]